MFCLSGDGEYKPYISAEPDVTTAVNNGSEEFLILGCDGLWDTITPEEATDLVYTHLEENQRAGGDIENLGARLATAAKDRGSGDNITIIVVFIMPVAEVIALGRRPVQGEPDMEGVSSTCSYVRHGGSNHRDSLPDFPSPNPSPDVSFANLEGGQMFSPSGFANADNGFNLSNEQFNNQIDDKRFSNESNERVSEEQFNGQFMDELLKQQSIKKVEDLMGFLGEDDTSPTPEEEDPRPLEEILAAAREQVDEADGVEDEDDSSDDEIVDFGACNELNIDQGESGLTPLVQDLHLGINTNPGEAASPSHQEPVMANIQGNAKLQEVLSLDDKSLGEDPEETDTFSENKDAFNESLQRRTYQEPVMDPCEQVTVKETGPQEYSTIVPPAQEMPTFQQPVLEIVDPMSCSMVKEESEQEAKTNGDADIISFEANENGQGFMLKTPGQNGGEMLAEFSPDQEPEPETSVDTADEPAAVVSSLTIPEVTMTPATPVKEMSPAPTPRQEPPAEMPQVAVVQETPTPAPAPAAAPASPKKTSTGAKSSAGAKTATKATPKAPAATAKAGAAKPTPGAAKTAATKPGATRTTPAATKPATAGRAATAASSASRTTSTRPASASLAGRAKPGDDTKSTRSGTGSTSSSVASGGNVARKTPTTGAAAKPMERKAMPTKPDVSATRKPTVPRTDSTKPKPETKDAKLPPKRPTSSTLSKTPSSTTPGVSSRASSASSASSSRPKPSTTSKPGTTTASRPSSAKTPASGSEVKKPTTSRLTSSRASSSSLRQTTSTAAAVNRSLPTSKPNPTTAATAKSTTTSTTSLRRTTSATATRATTLSTTAGKPTAAASRVAAARAAAMSKAPQKAKAKTSTTTTATTSNTTKKPDEANKEKEENDVNNKDVDEATAATKVNGHSLNDNDASSEANEPGEVMETGGAGDGDHGPQLSNGNTQTLNGLSEVSQSEC